MGEGTKESMQLLTERFSVKAGHPLLMATEERF